GQNITGYVHQKHVENTVKNQTFSYGLAAKEPTNIRDAASTKSNVLKQFKQGTRLSYKDFSKNWFEITITINGIQETGYIHKKHVNNTLYIEVNYSTDFNTVIDKQMRVAPQVWSNGGFIDASK